MKIKSLKKFLASILVIFSLVTAQSVSALSVLTVQQGGTGVGTLTGIIKGNGTSAFTVATSGTDYSLGTSALATGILKSTTGTGALTIATAADFPLNSLTATDTTLTFSGSYNGNTARTVGLNLGNSNTWTGQQIFNTTAPKFGTITGSTQCLHVDSTGLVSGTTTDCGSGSGGGTVTSVDTTTASNGITATWANGTTAARLTIAQASATPNTLVASDATTPHVDTTAGSTNTGYFLINGKTSGGLKITANDSTAQTVTLTTAAQTTGAATLTIPDMAHVNKTIAWLESPVFTTPNIGSATGSITGLAGTATALATGRAIWGQTFDGTGAISGAMTGLTTLTGGANNMTITAGTGASRTLALQTTTSGSTATTALTLAADQSATFANTVNATTFVGAFTGNVSGSSGSTTGNAATATKLAATKNINGVAFDGSGDITVTAAASTLTGSTLASGVTTSSLTTVGTLASPTLTTPVINGTITGTGQATAATASTIAMRDSSSNLTANNWLGGYTTTVTSSTPITLTVASTYLQFLTGSTAQTFNLPVVSTLALGTQYVIVNNSSAVTTVKSSGGQTVQAMGASSYAVVTSIATSGTDQTVWSASYTPAATNANTASTLVLRDSSGNFSAGTISAALTGNASTSTKTTNIIGGNSTTLLGSLPYQSNTDTTSLLSPNTTTTKNYLSMTGDGTNGHAPVWGTIASGDIPTLNQNTTGTANIAGGTAGAIPYQSGANATSVLAATATANKLLVSGASAAPTWSTPTFPNASATSGKIIKSDGTNWTASTETYAAPGSSGNVMTSDGTNWTSAAAAGKVVVITYNTSDSPATWTKQAGLKYMDVELWAGGGSGSGGSTGNSGGGGGGCNIVSFQAGQVGSTETVTIGAGGTASTNAVGKVGNNTSFGTTPYITVYGGGGGGGNASGSGGGGGGGTYSVGGNGTTTTGGAGGSPLGGTAASGAQGLDSTFGGGGGSSSHVGANSIYGGGGGGGLGQVGGNSMCGGGGGGGGGSAIAGGTSSFGGAGGTGGNASPAATAGSVPGGGGGGSTSGSVASGAGGNGRVILIEHY